MLQFFATPFGCNDPSCPFLHDKEKSVQARERILARRRTTLGKPTPRDIAAREKAARRAYEVSQRQVVPYQRPSVEATLDDGDDDDIDPELMKIYEESANIKAICNNPVCLQAKMKRGTGAQGAAPVKMKACAGCQMATYCSVSGPSRRTNSDIYTSRNDVFDTHYVYVAERVSDRGLEEAQERTLPAL